MQPHCPPIEMHERTQWTAPSAECILFPQINAQLDITVHVLRNA
jgi:hypothetical protein